MHCEGAVTIQSPFARQAYAEPMMTLFSALLRHSQQYSSPKTSTSPTLWPSPWARIWHRFFRIPADVHYSIREERLLELIDQGLLETIPGALAIVEVARMRLRRP